MIEPLHQFIVQPIIPIFIGKMDLSITNSVAFMFLGLFTIVAFFSLGFLRIRLIPRGLQVFAEWPFALIDTMLSETNGKEGAPFFSFIASIFLFVFVGNMIGMLPYAFTFTSQFIINLALASFILFCITIIGFLRQGLGFLRLFCPAGIPWWVAPILIPIEIISYLSKPLSLSIRLFANMVAGHSMLKIFAYFTLSIGVLGIFPMAINMGLIGFELLVAFLQAYVFAMLSCIYLHDALSAQKQTTSQKP